MLHILRNIFLALNLFAATFCGAQAPQFSQLARREGLSDNNVQCFLRDSRGYLWIGTLHGLNCYDGVSFSKFFWQPGTEHGLQYNLVRGLAEDKKGNIWIALARNGLQCYNPATKRWKNFRHKEGSDQTLRSDQLKSVHVDAQGRIWIGYAGYGGSGWSMYDAARKEFRHFQSPHKKLNRYGQDASNLIEGFVDDEKGNLWIASNYGLHRFDTHNKSIRTYKYLAADTGRQNLFTTLFRSDDSSLWLGTWGGGLKRFNTRTLAFTRFTYDPRTSEDVADAYNIVLSIARKNEHELWVGTADRGLGSFDEINHTFSFYPHQEADPGSPPAGGISSLLNDEENTLWLGSTQGIHYAALSRQPFQYHSIGDVAPEVKSIVSGSSFYQCDNGKLYVGMYAGKGLYEIDAGSNSTHVIPVSADAIQNISSIHPMKNSADLLIVCNAQLYRLTPGTRKIKLVRIALENGNLLPACADLLPTENGAFWYQSFEQGIFHVDRDVQQATFIESLPKSGTSMLLDEGDSTLWLHERDVALFRFQKNKNRPDRISISPALDGPIMLRKMVREHDGSYIALSEQMGVFRFRFDAHKHATFKQYTTAQGLPSDYGVDLLKDNSGMVWVMTQEGPAFLQEDHFVPYNEAGGWQKKWYYGSIYQSPDSTFYFGVAGGYLSSSSSALRPKHPPLNIQLTSLKIFDQAWNDSADLNSNLVLRLPHDQNFLSFSFLAPALPLASHIQYSWMLEGLDRNWVNGGDRRTITYSGLAYGNYRLRLRASGADGVWYERAQALHITILAPFWKTGWFVGLVTLAVLALAFLFYRARLNAVRRQERQKAAFQKQLAAIEMKALRAQMNPHFIFNCLNAINRNIVMSDQVTAADYVAKFAKLIRLILDNSNTDRTTLDKELLMLRLYLEMESLRFAGKFNYVMDIGKVHSPETILLPSMLIQPYIENAIWHGLLHKAGGGSVWLRLQDSGDLLRVEIEDNGIGRKAAAELKSRESNPQKSYGMKITGERLQMLHELHGVAASVEIEDLIEEDRAAGTRAILHIPIQRIPTEP